MCSEIMACYLPKKRHIIPSWLKWVCLCKIKFVQLTGGMFVWFFYLVYLYVLFIVIFYFIYMFLVVYNLKRNQQNWAVYHGHVFRNGNRLNGCDFNRIHFLMPVFVALLLLLILFWSLWFFIIYSVLTCYDNVVFWKNWKKK